MAQNAVREGTPVKGAEGWRPAAFFLAVLVAFAGVAFIPFFVHWYEVGVFGTDWPPVTTVNTLAPIAAFMAFVLIALVNPLLRLVAPVLAFGRRELALILSLWLLASAICFRDLGMRVLATAGNTFGPGVADKAIAKNRVREHLNPDFYLPEDEDLPAASDYHKGKSYDDKTRISAFPRSPLLKAGDLEDLVGLARNLLASQRPVSAFLAAQLSDDARRRLGALLEAADRLPAPLLDELNALCAGPSMYAAGRFGDLRLGKEFRRLHETLAGLKDVAERRRETVAQILSHLRSSETLEEASDLAAQVDRLHQRLRDARDEPERAAALERERAEALERLRALLTDPGAADEVIALCRRLEERLRRRQDLRDAVRKIIKENPRLERLRDPFGEQRDLLRANRRLLEWAWQGRIAVVDEDALREWTFAEADLLDVKALAEHLLRSRDPIAAAATEQFKPYTRANLQRLVQATTASEELLLDTRKAFVEDLNRLLAARPLYDPRSAEAMAAPDDVRALFTRKPTPAQQPEDDLARLAELERRSNRLLLELAYPEDLAAVDVGRAAPFSPGHLKNPSRLVRRIAAKRDDASRFVFSRLSAAAQERFAAFDAEARACEAVLAADLNRVISGPDLAGVPGLTADIALTTETKALRRLHDAALVAANRRLLEGALPDVLARAAGRETRAHLVTPPDLADLVGFERRLRAGTAPLAAYLAQRVSPATRGLLSALEALAEGLSGPLVEELNALLDAPLPLQRAWFQRQAPTREAADLFERAWEARVTLNRLVLEAAYPDALQRRPRGSERAPLLAAEDLTDVVGLAAGLLSPRDPLSARLGEALDADLRASLGALTALEKDIAPPLAEALNGLVRGPLLHDEHLFEGVRLSDDLRRRLAQQSGPAATAQLNRDVLCEAWPQEVRPRAGDAALFTPEDIMRPGRLVRRLMGASDPLSRSVRSRFNREQMRQFNTFVHAADEASAALAAALSRVMEAAPLDDPALGISLPEGAEALRAAQRAGEERVRLNRRLLETAYPREIVPAPKAGPYRFDAPALRSPERLVRRLMDAAAEDPVAAFARARFRPDNAERFGAFARQAEEAATALAKDLNAVLQGERIWADGAISEEALARRMRRTVRDLQRRERELNRRYVEEAYPGLVARIPASVPWGLWVRPLMFWGPLMLAFIALSTSLVRMVHRQWSRHELLTYPIAGVADALVGVRRGRLFPEVFYDVPFWIGFGLVVGVYGINGLQMWFPRMIQVPLGFAHYELIEKFYFLSKYCGREAYAFFRGWLYPFAVALAVLLPTELSLTCWLGWAIMVLGTGFYFLATGEVITAYETEHIQNGMYVAMAAAILFIGRREYWNVLRCALFVRRPDGPETRAAANACRIFIGSFFALAALLTWAGMDWFLALVLTGSFALVSLLLARLTAEAGLPWLVNFRSAAVMLPLRVLGAATFGPQHLAVMFSVGGALAWETTNHVASQQTTVSRLEEGLDGGSGRLLLRLAIAVGLLLTVAATVFFTLWENYSFGSRRETNAVVFVQDDLSSAAKEIGKLETEVGLEKVQKGEGLGRLRHWRWDWKYWRFFLLGAVLVALCAFLRLRFTWWPFHPLPLMFINTWAMSRMAFPIMIGWLLKVALLKIWGGKTFARSKTFFYGVVVGQIAIAGVWVVVSTIYYLVRDMTPVRFNSFY